MVNNFITKMKIILLLWFVSQIAAMKILVLLPSPIKSHFDTFEPLLKILTTRGHELTVVGHFPQKKQITGYKDINLNEGIKQINYLSLNNISNVSSKPIWGMNTLTIFAEEECKLLQKKNMKILANSMENFDIALTELFVSDCYLGFIHKFKVPFIALSSSPLIIWNALRLGVSADSAFMPHFDSPFSSDISFSRKVESVLYYLYTLAHYNYVILPKVQTEARRLFGEDLPQLDDIATNASLLLLNTHFSLNQPKTFLPNVIEVEGLHLKQHGTLSKVIFTSKPE